MQPQRMEPTNGQSTSTPEHSETGRRGDPRADALLTNPIKVDGQIVNPQLYETVHSIVERMGGTPREKEHLRTAARVALNYASTQFDQILIGFKRYWLETEQYRISRTEEAYLELGFSEVMVKRAEEKCASYIVYDPHGDEDTCLLITGDDVDELIVMAYKEATTGDPHG